MKNVKLSENDKRNLAAALMRKSDFAKQEIKIKNREDKVAFRVRNAVLGKHRKAFDSIPAELLQKKSYVQVAKIPDFDYAYVRFKEGCPCFNITVDFEVLSEALRRDILAILTELRDFKEEQKEFRAKLHAVVRSFSSTKKLFEALPEASDPEVWPSSLAYKLTAPKYLPAVPGQQLDEIRNKLGKAQ